MCSKKDLRWLQAITASLLHSTVLLAHTSMVALSYYLFICLPWKTLIFLRAESAFLSSASRWLAYWMAQFDKYLLNWTSRVINIYWMNLKELCQYYTVWQEFSGSGVKGKQVLWWNVNQRIPREGSKLDYCRQGADLIPSGAYIPSSEDKEHIYLQYTLALNI